MVGPAGWGLGGFERGRRGRAARYGRPAGRPACLNHTRRPHRFTSAVGDRFTNQQAVFFHRLAERSCESHTQAF